MSMEEKQAKAITQFLKGQSILKSLLTCGKMEKPEYNRAVSTLRNRLNIPSAFLCFNA